MKDTLKKAFEYALEGLAWLGNPGAAYMAYGQKNESAKPAPKNGPKP